MFKGELQQIQSCIRYRYYTGGLNVNFARGVFDSSGAENCFIPCNGAKLCSFLGEQNASFTNVFMAPFQMEDRFFINPKYQEQLRVTQEFRFTSDATEDLFGLLEHSLKILLTKDLQI